MAHYALIGADNIVKQVTVIQDAWEADGEDACIKRIGDWINSFQVLKEAFNIQPGDFWKKTSYTSSIRYNFAGAGMLYDPKAEAFYGSSPDKGMVLDTNFQWVKAK